MQLLRIKVDAECEQSSCRGKELGALLVGFKDIG